MGKEKNKRPVRVRLDELGDGRVMELANFLTLSDAP